MEGLGEEARPDAGGGGGGGERMLWSQVDMGCKELKGV